ncbi:MAG: glycogen debranching protein GlgX [Alphaproteobacteria bacterium]|nr:glycogen debranching protein GlgX [Alphaproteobacteria bacterium]
MKPRLLTGAGRADPRGATLSENGVNFSVYSEAASRIWVSLFDKDGTETGRFELDGRDGPVFFGFIAGIGVGARYGLRADGPYDPSLGLWFDPDKLLVDPYARRLDKGFALDPALAAPRGAGGDTAALVPKALVSRPEHAPARPLGKVPGLIYELNARGFTKLSRTLPARVRGRVTALTLKSIPTHFDALGVDAIELMPVAAWIDDLHLPARKLSNAWGYNPVTLLAPDPRLMPGGIADLRGLTDFYRARGVAVVLDVVFNHTGEGDAHGPVLSFRGLDAVSYYRHSRDEFGRLHLINDMGTGNALDCAHPEVQRLLLDAMRFFVEQGGASGFRFDLATALGRGPNGFSADAPLIAAIRADPLLSSCILIVEPWDVGPGGYQLGRFGPPFFEWNDRYRDDIRAFWRGDAGVDVLASRLAGSSDVFQRNGWRQSASINFLAAHDGFALRDLVSYAQKHNFANGENNRDGHGHNISWNCGAEGETDDPHVERRRLRDASALLATLFVSRGTPMIQQGDEFWRTQGGNNNAYAQDNSVTWIDWDRADTRLIDYVARLSAFRAAHPALAGLDFLTGENVDGVRDVVWLHPKQREFAEKDWQDASVQTLGMKLDIGGDELLVWFNRASRVVQAFSPLPRTGGSWTLGIASTQASGFGAEPGHVTLPARSVVVLVPEG